MAARQDGGLGAMTIDCGVLLMIAVTISILVGFVIGAVAFHKEEP